MSRESSEPGGCLVTILIILVIGAAFGLIEWSTVGNFARFLVYFVIAGAILIGLIFLRGYLSNKDN